MTESGVPELGPFPVDELSLTLMKESLSASYIGHDEEGNPVMPEGVVSFSKLIEFFSGYDESKLVETQLGPFTVMSYPGTLYSGKDVLLALIGEIERLRDLHPGSDTVILDV